MAKVERAQRLRVLLVDDSAAARTLIKLYLAPRDCDFAEAASGVDGLRAALTQPFDLAIADLNMPGMDGFTMFRLLRAQPAGKGLPLLLLSSDPRAEYLVSEGRAAGANAVLRKPVTAVDLLHAVDELTHVRPAPPRASTGSGRVGSN